MSGDLKAVVMSATLDAKKLRVFSWCTVNEGALANPSGGSVCTVKLEQSCVEAAVQTTLKIRQCEGPDMPELVVCPIYLSLPPSQHRIIVNPAPPPHVPGGPPGQKVV
eukprot:3008153-Ditylum_brightwellii.AAC.1